MSQKDYSVERVLQLVRASFNEQMGDLSSKVFSNVSGENWKPSMIPALSSPRHTTTVRVKNICTNKPQEICRKLPTKGSSIY